MKMKYFRFLYGETGQCFLHFGELQDTTREGTYTFLYLRRVEKQVAQTASEHRLFLFPEQIDLVVLGSADKETGRILKKLLQGRKIGTLILSEQAADAGWEETEEIRETVRLGGGTFHSEAAGWHFLARSFADGTIAMAHGLPSGMSGDVFEDCVMSVKALREGLPCQKAASLDGYGCALGCALYQDYDVCKYRENGGKSGFRTGTLLFGGSEETADCAELLRDVNACVGEPRFFGLAGRPATNRSVEQKSGAISESVLNQIAVLRENLPKRKDVLTGFRRYLIGTEELDDETVAKLCGGGWYQRPILLREGEGICCSGLLKYSEPS